MSPEKKYFRHTDLTYNCPEFESRISDGGKN